MTLKLLLFQSIVWISVQAIREVSVISGRVVFCERLPKQNNQDLEDIAAKMRNSFCEILDPAFDEEGKVRLRWLGDEQICGAVRRRFLRSVPFIFLHFIEIDDGSMPLYLAQLAFKIGKDHSQIVRRGVADIQENIKNQHVVLTGSYSAFYQEYLNESASHYGSKIAPKVLDLKVIKIPHQINEKQMKSVVTKAAIMEQIASKASPKSQCWFPLQRPALRIHLFPDEKAFVDYGGDLYDEVTNDSKQIVMVAAIDAPRMMRWWWYWQWHPALITRSGSGGMDLLVVLCVNTMSDPKVFNDKHSLSWALLGMFTNAGEGALSPVLDKMKSLPGYKSTIGKKMTGPNGRIKNLVGTLAHKRGLMYNDWSKKERLGMSLEQKSRLLDDHVKQLQDDVIAELGLRKAEMREFWKLFGIAAREYWSPVDISVEGGLARDLIETWHAIDVHLDPSFTMNVVLLGGPDVNRALMKATCFEMGYSWKALRRSLEWIDYGSDECTES